MLSRFIVVLLPQAADFLTEPVDADTYSLVVCRDVLISVQDKLQFLQRMLSWLKPGGQLLLTDYCSVGVSVPQELREYLNCNRFSAVEHREFSEVRCPYGFFMLACAAKLVATVLLSFVVVV